MATKVTIQSKKTKLTQTIDKSLFDSFPSLKKEKYRVLDTIESKPKRAFQIKEESKETKRDIPESIAEEKKKGQSVKKETPKDNEISKTKEK